jgi:tetratricopeptide (TPR) repeat protein
MSLAGWRARLLAALLLAATTFAVFAPVRANGFVDYDDGAYVTKNPEVQAGLTPAGLAFAFGEFHSANWHPLTWLSHMLDVELFGAGAAGPHLVNAALHALAAALCFLFLASTTGTSGASLLVALVFAVHPLRVESVAWVSERKDVLSGALFFATLLAYAAYARRPGPGRYLVTLGLFAAGLLAKPMLVTLPLVLCLLDLWPLARVERGRIAGLVREKVPFLVLSLASGIVTILAQRAGEAIRSFETLPVGARLANACLAWVSYLAKSVWPTELAVFYPHPGLVSGVRGWTPAAIGAALALVAITLAVLRLRARAPWLLVGWAWYLVTSLPVIGILQVGAQWMADRYTYLPLVGVVLAVVFGVARALPTRRARLAAAALPLAGVLVLVPLTRAQISVWRDTRTLFEHALAVTERNYVAHLNLGFLEQNQGNAAAAEAHYLAALEIAPRSPDAYSNLGGLYYYAYDDLARARESLERALAIDPGFLLARLNLGLVRRDLGDPEGAISEFRAARALEPDGVDASRMLAEELARAGRAAEALDVLDEVLARRPSAHELLLQRAELRIDGGRPREALADLERLLESPSPPAGTFALHAWLLATSADPVVRDPAAALRSAERAQAAGGPRWKALRALAAALAATRDFTGAASTALEAAAAAPTDKEATLLEEHRLYSAREALSR